MTAPEEIILDQNVLAAGRKFLEVAVSVLSDDGNLLAYLVDFIGFRQYQLQIKDLRTGEVLADTAERVTSVEWAADNRTLFLTTEDETTKRSDKLFRYRVRQLLDLSCFTRKAMSFSKSVWRNPGTRLIFFSRSRVRIRPRSISLLPSVPGMNFQVFLPREKAHRYYLDHRLGLFYLRTNKDAKDFRVVTVSPTEKSRSLKHGKRSLSTGPEH